jgi:hypothetical protein
MTGVKTSGGVGQPVHRGLGFQSHQVLAATRGALYCSYSIGEVVEHAEQQHNIEWATNLFRREIHYVDHLIIDDAF